MKIKQKLMILMCISALFLSACNGEPQTAGSENDIVQTQGTVVQQETDLSKFTKDPFDNDDLYQDWTKSKTTIITMDAVGIKHDGNENSGVNIEGNHITITKSGAYSITGVCDDGSVTIDCDEPGTVRVILDNCSLTSQSGSAFNVNKAEKVVVTSNFGTSNMLADAEGNGEAAAVVSKENLSFNGEGQLTICGYQEDAVSCEKDLKFVSGTYVINAKENGAEAVKGISLKNGSYTVQANGAAFKTTGTGDAEGFIGIETGSYNLTTGGNAIDAAGSIYYLNGSLTTTTGVQGTLADGAVAKGLQAGGNFEMYGGSGQLQTADDAVYVKGNVKIATGCLNITSQDDGIVAGETITISGGSIVLSQCVEGFEANGVDLSGGYIDINSTDDGINVCGGTDASAREDRLGINDIERNGEGELTIDQTCINVKSDADAIDVAGNFTVTTGAVYVRGGQAEGNSSIACSKDFVIKSGNVNYAGTDAEMLAPSEASEQNTVILEYKELQQPSAIICIKNSKDELVSCFAPAAPFMKAAICKEELKDGEKYSWYAATIKDDAVTTYGEIASEDVTMGDKIADFTVEKGITIVK